MSKSSTARSFLPNISSTPSLSYTQRYEHMTKLANYNQLNEGQIWKEYEKLRTCLKELNEQVLYHMERKAYSNLNNKQKPKQSKDSQGTLILLQDEKKTNDLRYSNFYNQLLRLEQRTKFLSEKHNYLQELTINTQKLQGRIKQIKKQNKGVKRKAKLMGRSLVNCTSYLDKLIFQQDKLNRAYIRHRRFQQVLQKLSDKEQTYKQKINEVQAAIDSRLQLFSKQQNFIQQEIHYQRYEQLKKQKQTIAKYEPIYKRNYLMKLKELQNLVNSVSKHEKIIQQTQGNIVNMRPEIDSISTLIGPRKRTSSSLMQMSLQSGRVKSKQNKNRASDVSLTTQVKQQKESTSKRNRIPNMNDKNQSNIGRQSHLTDRQ